MNYGLLVWGEANKGIMTKIFRLQKRALRTISNSSYLSPSNPLFKKYKVLNIFDMYKNELAIFMYKYKYGMLPSSFDGIFTAHLENHKYNTRNKCDFQIPMQRVQTISSAGPKIWNSLPKYVKLSESFGQFKTKLKNHLMGWLGLVYIGCSLVRCGAARGEWSSLVWPALFVLLTWWLRRSTKVYLRGWCQSGLFPVWRVTGRGGIQPMDTGPHTS